MSHADWQLCVTRVERRRSPHWLLWAVSGLVLPFLYDSRVLLPAFYCCQHGDCRQADKYKHDDSDIREPRHATGHIDRSRGGSSVTSVKSVESVTNVTSNSPGNVAKTAVPELPSFAPPLHSPQCNHIPPPISVPVPVFTVPMRIAGQGVTWVKEEQKRNRHAMQIRYDFRGV